MAKTLTSRLTLKGNTLSGLIGKCSFLEAVEVKNYQTGEITGTKVSIFCQKQKDMFDVTVPADIDFSGYKDMDEIDFTDVDFDVTANGKAGFNGGAPTGYVTTRVTAKAVVPVNATKKQ